ncbi:glycerate kinase [Cohnella endophytica]|uniref:Glycerate kinase n=1 Tax=Cohnella endophytica TaxID=2419778 RepID=A0A494XA12_9BACL|nr:glycerate kinase [Cohnella endophytica]RKP47340.1 glycerate kinase [Cohnella endophytica]
MEKKRELKVLIAPDSFKGSLSASEAAEAMARGVSKAVPGANVTLVPVADGGEGTVEAFLRAVGGVRREAKVTGPLGEPVDAFYGIVAEGTTAVIEMAAASGLPLIPANRRNPLLATSFGTGELIRHALNSGCRKIILGLGGSATVDGGMGLIQALGARVMDASGQEIERGGQGLEQVATIGLDEVDARLGEIDIEIMCDVSNPLCGPDGAAAVYGPQKGATQEMVTRLDRGLSRAADIAEQLAGQPCRDIPGCGAAGGLLVGLWAITRRLTLRPGFEVLSETSGLREAISRADLVLTGEGRTDSQSANGKVPAGIGELAEQCGKTAVCLSGSLGDGAELLLERGISALFSAIDAPMELDEAMANAGALLERAAGNIVRLYVKQ